MNFYKLGDTVHSFEDNQLYLITPEMVKMTESEIKKHTTPKPFYFYTWDDVLLEWIDNRTAEEIAEYERSLLPKLSKRQFSLYLFDNKMYDQVMGEINANPRFKIEFDTVADIERLSPTVSAMTTLLKWTDEQVDAMWQQALTL